MSEITTTEKVAIGAGGAVALGVAMWWVVGPSPNFRWSEFNTTSTGLPNPLPTSARVTITRLAWSVLEPIREQFGPIRINSAYRSPAVTAAVGGSATSSHAFPESGEGGLDIQVADGSAPNKDIARWIANQGSRFDFLDQIIVYEDRSHVHLGVRNQPRNQWLSHNAGTYTSWNPFA